MTGEEDSCQNTDNDVTVFLKGLRLLYHLNLYFLLSDPDYVFRAKNGHIRGSVTLVENANVHSDIQTVSLLVDYPHKPLKLLG